MSDPEISYGGTIEPDDWNEKGEGMDVSIIDGRYSLIDRLFFGSFHFITQNKIF